MASALPSQGCGEKSEANLFEWRLYSLEKNKRLVHQFVDSPPPKGDFTFLKAAAGENKASQWERIYTEIKTSERVLTATWDYLMAFAEKRPRIGVALKDKVIEKITEDYAFVVMQKTDQANKSSEMIFMRDREITRLSEALKTIVTELCEAEALPSVLRNETIDIEQVRSIVRHHVTTVRELQQQLQAIVDKNIVDEQEGRNLRTEIERLKFAIDRSERRQERLQDEFGKTIDQHEKTVKKLIQNHHDHVDKKDKEHFWQMQRMNQQHERQIRALVAQQHARPSPPRASLQSVTAYGVSRYSDNDEYDDDMAL